jgi:hypothetical protein
MAGITCPFTVPAADPLRGSLFPRGRDGLLLFFRGDDRLAVAGRNGLAERVVGGSDTLAKAVEGVMGASE